MRPSFGMAKLTSFMRIRQVLEIDAPPIRHAHRQPFHESQLLLLPGGILRVECPASTCRRIQDYGSLLGTSSAGTL
jgi:hypothetical protein